MRIGIDARLYGLEHAGIGRYVKNLVDRLIKLDTLYEFTLFLKEPYFSALKVSNPTIKKQIEIRHYTLKEQLFMPGIFDQEKLDLLHVPHFNVPLLYHSPLVVTIHDILWHQFKGSAVTTLSPLMYRLKYQAYKKVVLHAVKTAKAILVPSQYVKKQLLKEFPELIAGNIIVTYEGVDPKSHLINHKSYLLYVGSCYPHKNLNLVVNALKLYNQKNPPLTLKIVSSRNVFRDRLQAYIASVGMESWVKFAGKLSDPELNEAYSQSLATIQPSLSEGFGLTGLESMAQGTPVIAAQAAAMPEIYGDAALWFNPYNLNDLVNQIQAVQKPDVQQEYITKGYSQVKKYSWDNMVDQTVAIYSSILNHES